jgi:hypothetical protein
MDEVTELERVKLENYALKHNNLQRQLQDNLAERAAFIKEVEAAHPALRWDDQRGFVSKEEPRPQPISPKRMRG